MNRQFCCRVEKSVKLFDEILNGIFYPKLSRPTVRKNCSRDREKLVKFEAEVTITFYANSGRSKQFWKLVLGGFSDVIDY